MVKKVSIKEKSKYLQKYGKDNFVKLGYMPNLSIEPRFRFFISNTFDILINKDHLRSFWEKYYFKAHRRFKKLIVLNV